MSELTQFRYTECVYKYIGQLNCSWWSCSSRRLSELSPNHYHRYIYLSLFFQLMWFSTLSMCCPSLLPKSGIQISGALCAWMFTWSRLRRKSSQNHLKWQWVTAIRSSNLEYSIQLKPGISKLSFLSPIKWQGLISNLGGIWGFYLGFSAVTVVEVIEYFHYLITLLSSKCRKKAGEAFRKWKSPQE